MAVVKVKFVKHSARLAQYVMENRGPNDVVDGVGCIPEHAADDFADVADLHGNKGTIQAVHVIQSWSEEESKKLSPEVFNEMGKELVGQHFKGHDFMIVTHTNTGKTHNHIVVNPWNMATGKKIEFKMKHLHELRSKSDILCAGKGLSIISGINTDGRAKLPEKVRNIVKFNGKSHLYDLCQKADFARAYSTSFDEYAGTLSDMGIGVRVEKKNITYFHPGSSRGKRGSNLGEMYDKPHLQKAFKHNDQGRDLRFVRERVKSAIDVISKDKNISSGKMSELANGLSGCVSVGQKDYSAYTKISRKEWDGKFPHQKGATTSLVSSMDLYDAQQKSIPSYCRTNKIKLENNADGKLSLKGRDHVVVSDKSWINTKNGTRGSLIEFVAAYKNKSFLQAVAEINHNPRLLMIEDLMGEVKRGYTPFCAPKQGGKNHGGKIANIARQLKGDKAKETSQLFFFHKGIGEKATIFTDPFEFTKARGKNSFDNIGDHSVVCLTKPSKKSVDLFLIKNPNVKHINVVSGGGKGGSDFHLELSKRYKPYRISVASKSCERAFHEMDRGLSLDI